MSVPTKEMDSQHGETESEGADMSATDDLSAVGAALNAMPMADLTTTSEQSREHSASCLFRDEDLATIVAVMNVAMVLQVTGTGSFGDRGDDENEGWWPKAGTKKERFAYVLLYLAVQAEQGADGYDEYDEDLFKPPSKQACPICFLPVFIDTDQSIYNSCCSNSICQGCQVKQAAVLFGPILREP